jgi:hypothetical protein
MKKLIYFILPFILFMRCSDDESQAAAAVSFESSSSQVEEDGTYKTIDVVMSQAMEADVEVAFETSGNAAQNGHYRLITPSPILIEAGDTRGEIVFEAIDNTVLEPEPPLLIVELTSAGGAQLAEGTLQRHEVQIMDNNEVPENDLQLDLLWNLDSGGDIDQVDLDLYLVTNLVMEEGTVQDFDPVELSEGESGFETVVLHENDPDQEYFLLVLYLEGEKNVDFRIHASNANFGTSVFVEEAFADNEVGGGRVYGPIPKQGNSYFGERIVGARHSLYQGMVPVSWLK